MDQLHDRETSAGDLSSAAQALDDGGFRPGGASGRRADRRVRRGKGRPSGGNGGGAEPRRQEGSHLLSAAREVVGVADHIAADRPPHTRTYGRSDRLAARQIPGQGGGGDLTAPGPKPPARGGRVALAPSACQVVRGAVV